MYGGAGPKPDASDSTATSESSEISTFLVLDFFAAFAARQTTMGLTRTCAKRVSTPGQGPLYSRPGHTYRMEVPCQKE
jgi:hypothetical protein